jgi:hypothetical protein
MTITKRDCQEATKEEPGSPPALSRIRFLGNAASSVSAGRRATESETYRRFCDFSLGGDAVTATRHRMNDAQLATTSVKERTRHRHR